MQTPSYRETSNRFLGNFMSDDAKSIDWSIMMQTFLGILYNKLVCRIKG